MNSAASQPNPEPFNPSSHLSLGDLARQTRAKLLAAGEPLLSVDEINTYVQKIRGGHPNDDL